VNSINGTSEQFDFRYILSDGTTAAATSNTVTVTNQYPTAVNDTYTTHGTLGWGTHATVLANDSDPDGDSISMAAYPVVAGPSHGSITFNSSGDFSYRPDAPYVGSDLVTYKVCDDYGLCSTANITFNVVNQPPTAVDDIYVVRGKLAWGGGHAGVLSNDSDADGDALSMGNLGSWGTEQQGSVAFNSNGTFAYTPFPNFAGLDKFVYQVCDTKGVCSNATMYFLVLGDAENAGTASCNAFVGKPINVTNGNMYLQQGDYSLPGAGPAINITRTYNSISQRVGLFGLGWSTAYDESIQAYDNNLLRLNLPDGQAAYFGRTATTGAFSPLTPDFRGQVTKNSDGSFTLSLKDGRTHNFNAAGKLLSLTDRNNNQTTLTYGTGGKLTSITDPFGRTLTVLTYGTGGKLTSITDPFGRTLTVTTDANGQVLSVSDALGTISTYTYGGSQQLLSVTYADNSLFQFSYVYANGKLVLKTVTDALGNIVETHTYDSTGRALTSEAQGGVERYTLNYVSATETDVTDALNHVTKYFYDKSKGRNVVTRVEGSCDCGGGTTAQTWTYDSKLNVLTKTNGLNQTTTFTYDADGNPLTVTNALGTTTLTYNGFGEVLTATDPMQGVTTNTYDAQGNLLTIKDALNNTTTFTYDTRGQLLTAKDARNNVTTLTRDASGRLSEVKDAANHTTTYAYDSRARMTSATNALNEATGYEYDAAGRLKKIIYPDTSYVQYTYDLGGRRTKVRDARGNETSFAYDRANRLTSVTDAANQTTSYSYDLMSNLTSQTDALSRTTNYEYDSFNRLNKIINPPAIAGATRLNEQIAYDAGGRVTSRTDEAGRVTSYEYDSGNRLIKVTDPALKLTQYEYNARSQMTAVVDALSQRYEFTYDALGRATQVTRGGISMSYAYDAVGNRTGRTDYNNATTSYTYDNLNRLTTVAYPDTTTASYAYDQLSRLSSATNANGVVSFSYDNRNRISGTTDVFNQTVGYGYDANSNRTSLNLNGLTSATYQYDALNRLSQLTDNTGLSVGYGYDATNKLSSRSLPNGVTASYQYDGLDRLTRLTNSKAAGAITVSDNQYQYNTASQITQIAEPSRTRNFGYDATDRLTSMTSPTLTGETYAYDAVGNRTSSHLSASYTHQPFNKLVSTSTATYSYDNNGNLISKTDSSGVWQYSWDYENRLKQVTRPDGTTISYKYDALGRRIQRRKSLLVGEDVLSFTYDGEDVVQDRNEAGVVITSYLNGPGIDNKIRQTGLTGTLYYLHDHLQSTTALTDTLGNVIEQQSYDSFGNSANSNLTRYGYTGREWDSDTTLYYYRNRWYDPQMGRFISEDPVGLAGGINTYSYVENSPVGLVDPLGLCPRDSNAPTDSLNSMQSDYNKVERCTALRKRLIRQIQEYLRLKKNYRPEKDFFGGWESMKQTSTGIKKIITKRGSHYRAMKNLQKVIRENSEAYKRECMDRNDNSNPQYPVEAEDIVSEDIPAPYDPNAPPKRSFWDELWDWLPSLPTEREMEKHRKTYPWLYPPPWFPVPVPR